jgi:hypothetical protein
VTEEIMHPWDVEKYELLEAQVKIDKMNAEIELIKARAAAIKEGRIMECPRCPPCEDVNRRTGSNGNRPVYMDDKVRCTAIGCEDGTMLY